MAHFAKLDDNNVVLAVHVVNNDVITVDGVESEQVGIDFLSDLHGHSSWKQTSYNGTIRKNYAGIGYTYDVGRDAFIPPKPWASWTLNETTCQWEPPVAYPTDGKRYAWFEPNQEWIEIKPQA
jgi:hypothetical protein